MLDIPSPLTEGLQPPLVVDLDGTLLSSDLLFETGMDYLRHQPLNFYKPLFWLLKGKTSLKEKVQTRDPRVQSTLVLSPIT